MSSELKVNSIRDTSNNEAITISSGNVSFNNTISAGTIGSGVNFNPAIGQLAFYHGYVGGSNSVSCTLDGVNTYTVLCMARQNSGDFYPKSLTLKINSSNGAISEKNDAWGTAISEGFNNSTKVLTLTMDSSTEATAIFVFLGSATKMT